MELMPHVFFRIMMFMKLYAFGKCTGITFVDSIPHTYGKGLLS
ncbi:hypothetical protein HMPREF3226_02050 [Prevotella corporis]|uniref:Uncharacterized protein n=1 Tax=Prevotella corporis TaxID=28128 RepID=A0A133PYS6_9BACT|nr:hypothetical protein HMPREF3226_02050 [Prevotella corporis]